MILLRRLRIIKKHLVFHRVFQPIGDYMLFLGFQEKK